MLGSTEIIVLVVVIGVLIFGAKKIPELAKTFGKAKGEFEKGKISSNSFSIISKEIKIHVHCQPFLAVNLEYLYQQFLRNLLLFLVVYLCNLDKLFFLDSERPILYIGFCNCSLLDA